MRARAMGVAAVVLGFAIGSTAQTVEDLEIVRFRIGSARVKRDDGTRCRFYSDRAAGVSKGPAVNCNKGKKLKGAGTPAVNLRVAAINPRKGRIAFHYEGEEYWIAVSMVELNVEQDVVTGVCAIAGGPRSIDLTLGNKEGQPKCVHEDE